MFAMSKKKPTTPAKKPNRADSVSVQFYADRDTVEALARYAASLPPEQAVKKRGVWIGAMRNFLASKGYWPPPAGARPPAPPATPVPRASSGMSGRLEPACRSPGRSATA